MEEKGKTYTDITDHKEPPQQACARVHKIAVKLGERRIEIPSVAIERSYERWRDRIKVRVRHD